LGLSSPSMLLKMAFIKEGLGDIPQAMYYLNKYYLISHDIETLKKMERLAEEHNLKGYQTDESDIMFTWYREYYAYLVLGVLSVGLLLFSLNVFLMKKNKKRPIPAFILLVFVLILSFGLTNYGELPEEGIILHPKTLAMSAPASSAKLVSVYSPGHKVTILDKEDVWYKLLVDGDVVYIRDHNIIPLGK
ncbi:MAG: SH3 domain-containing protein, partial [Cyclobacteriaceae bacterium]|nr:SH3 domain-containing protein [Cyclobacteriaceae bacterium]